MKSKAIKGRKEDKLRLAGMATVAILVTSTFALYAATIFMQGQILQAALALMVGLVLVTFAIMFVIRNYTSVKQGFPLQDERSKKVMLLALARAYLWSIYWILAIGWASDDWIKFRDVSQATGLGILGMAVIFGLCWVYYNRKPNLD